jgi:hypothetical protein
MPVIADEPRVTPLNVIAFNTTVLYNPIDHTTRTPRTAKRTTHSYGDIAIHMPTNMISDTDTEQVTALGTKNAIDIEQMSQSYQRAVTNVYIG